MTKSFKELCIQKAFQQIKVKPVTHKVVREKTGVTVFESDNHLSCINFLLSKNTKHPLIIITHEEQRMFEPVKKNWCSSDKSSPHSFHKLLELKHNDLGNFDGVNEEDWAEQNMLAEHLAFMLNENPQGFLNNLKRFANDYTKSANLLDLVVDRKVMLSYEDTQELSEALKTTYNSIVADMISSFTEVPWQKIQKETEITREQIECLSENNDAIYFSYDRTTTLLDLLAELK